ncbi:MAG: hypothetical protein AAGG81_08715 [Chlamydiota bacterium]
MVVVNSEYYAVSMNIFPFKYGEEQEIGCYLTEYAAKSIERIVRSIFQNNVSGGIDLFIRKYEGRIRKTSAGLRLDETPNGCITMIYDKVSHAEVKRILHFVPTMLESQLIEP